MTNRSIMLSSGIAGAIWALATVFFGASVIDIPIFALTPTLMLAFLGPGVVLACMVFFIAVRRFLSDDLASGVKPASGSPADIDRRVLGNTLEQTVIALCLWPAIGLLAANDGPGLLTALSLTFMFSRLVFWIGYRRAPALRMIGWSATFYSTLFALAWSLLIWFV